MKFGIIGGSGLARLAELREPRRQVVRTPWGDPSCPLTHGRMGDAEVVFLARHGYGHTLAPHEINYRANIWALKQAGVDGVVSVATVGGIRDDFGPGTLVLPDQIIDYTTGRCCTFFEGPGQPVIHVDFTWPYDEGMRTLLARAAEHLGETMASSGTYGCAQGPRLETAAEIRRMARDGCDLVGMTGMPEAVLARELELPYAALAVVANHAAGTGDSSQSVSIDAITVAVEQAMTRVRAILLEFVRLGAAGG